MNEVRLTTVYNVLFGNVVGLKVIQNPNTSHVLNIFNHGSSKNNHWIEHVTFGVLYVKFRLSTRLFYWGIPGFATDFCVVFDAVV